MCIAVIYIYGAWVWTNRKCCINAVLGDNDDDDDDMNNDDWRNNRGWECIVDEYWPMCGNTCAVAQIRKYFINAVLWDDDDMNNDNCSDVPGWECCVIQKYAILFTAPFRAKFLEKFTCRMDINRFGQNIQCVLLFFTFMAPERIQIQKYCMNAVLRDDDDDDNNDDCCNVCGCEYCWYHSKICRYFMHTKFVQNFSENFSNGYWVVWSKHTLCIAANIFKALEYAKIRNIV